MSCTIADLVTRLDSNNQPVPTNRGRILISPTQRPLFVSINSSFTEIWLPERTVFSNEEGEWSVVLPWPSEQDPQSNSWIIQLPDGMRFQGNIPEGVEGPLTIHQLKDDYGWALLSSVAPTGSSIIPVAIQGPPGPAGGISGVSAGSQVGASGVIQFANANGVSFGMDGSSVVTASFSASAQTIQPAIQGVSAGSRLQTIGTLAFSDANGVSFGLGSGTASTVMTAAVAAFSQSTAPAAIAAGTNQAESGTVIFSNSNNVSFGMDPSGVVTASASAPAQSVQPGIAGIVAGGGTATTASVEFANGNGVSFGLAGSQVTASVAAVPAGATATGNFGALSAGSQAASSGTVAFSNANGVSFGMSNSNAITASFSSPVAGSAIQGVGSASGSGTQTSQFAGADHVHPGVGAISIAGNTAGTVTGGPGTVVIAGGPNVTLSGATAPGGMTVSISAASGGGGGASGGVALGAGSQTASSGTVAFSNGNGVTFGMSGSSQVTASVGAGATATGNFGALAAGTQVAVSGTVSLANANGISFGMANSNEITASYTVPNVPAQTTQPGIAAVSAGTQTATTGTLRISNSNNVSFGLGSGASTNVLTASIPAGATATGNFGALSAGTQSAGTGTVQFANSNGISFGMSGSNQITASYTVPSVPAQSTQPGVTAISAGTQTATTGAVTFSNSNNVSFGLGSGTATNILTASIPSGATATGNFGGISAGTQSASSGFVQLANANGISFGMNGSSQVTASYTVPNVPAQTTQPGVAAISAGTQTATTGTVVFSNSHNVSFGLGSGASSNQLTASASYSQSTAPAAVAAGTQTATNGTVVLGNSNGISFGMSANTITASYTVPSVPAQTTQPGIAAVSAGTQTATTGTLVFSNSNNVSFGLGSGTATNILTAQVSYTSPIAGSAVQAVGSVTGSGTATSQFAAVDHVHAGLNSLSVIGNTSGTVTAGAGSLVLAGGPNVTLSGATAPGGMTLSISAQSGGGGGGGGGAALSAGSQSVSTGTVAFSNSNGVSFGMSGSNVITASVAPGIVSVGTSSGTDAAFQFADGNGVSWGAAGSVITASVASQSVQPGIAAISAGTQVGTTQTVEFANANGVSFGMSSSTRVTASVAVFSNSNGISFGTSGGSQVTASYQAIKSLQAGTSTATNGAVVFSYSNDVSFGMNNGTVTASIVPRYVSSYNAYPGAVLVAGQQGQGTLHVQPYAVDEYVAFDRFVMPMMFTATSNQSGSFTASLFLGIYTKNGSSLSLASSTSQSFAATMSGTVGSYSLYSGLRLFTIGSTGTLVPGEYYVGILSRTTTAGAAGMTLSQALISQINSAFGHWGVSTNSTNQMTAGLGVYSVTQSSLPGSFGFSQLQGWSSVHLRNPALYLASSTY